VASIKNKKILILGGTGFLGNKLISSLLNDNLQIYLLARNSRTRKDLQKYNSNINIKIFDWIGTDSKIIEKILKEVNCVINLCGILYENRAGDFDRVHSELPSLLGELCLKNKKPTIPSTIADEIKANIFFRVNDPDVKKAINLENSPDIEIFTKLRDLKDNF